MDKISLLDVQHQTIESLLIELTKGYNVMPKDQKMKSLIEDAINVVCIYQTGLYNE